MEESALFQLKKSRQVYHILKCLSRGINIQKWWQDFVYLATTKGKEGIL